MKQGLFLLWSLLMAMLLRPSASLSLEMQSSAKIPLADLRAMAGPWECHDSKDNTYGVWITSRTEVHRNSGLETIVSQTGSFRVYQWGPAGTSSGYFSMTGPNSISKLEDRHLVIDFKGGLLRNGPFLLDVHFDSNKLFWKGIWTPCGGASEVMLERPISDATTTRNPLVGDWQGLPGNSSDGFPFPLPEASSLIRIREDRTGRLIGWIEWFNPIDNERGAQTYGDEMVFSSTSPDSFKFEPGASANCGSCSVSLRFEGAYSQDKKEIIGKWSYYRVSGLVRDTLTSFQRIQ